MGGIEGRHVFVITIELKKMTLKESVGELSRY